MIKQTREFSTPAPGIHEFAVTTLNGSLYEGPMAMMGQRLMNPPTVEGWHTGFEWIESGTLSERVSFVEKQFSDPQKPGVADILSRLGDLNGDPKMLVDKCLDLLGAIVVRAETYDSLIEYTKNLKEIGDDAGVHHLVQMVTSTIDYQFE